MPSGSPFGLGDLGLRLINNINSRGNRKNQRAGKSLSPDVSVTDFFHLVGMNEEAIAMQLYYRSGGARDILLGQEPLSDKKWERLNHGVCKLLRDRNHVKAAHILEEVPFRLFNGTNGFQDEFVVLHVRAAFEQYNWLLEQYADAKGHAFQLIAETFTEVGYYVRFIVADLDTDSLEIVPSPNLEITTEVVERALADVEKLIQAQGPISGIDRVHTALHGYLRAIAKKSQIAVPDDASITQLFREIREKHPSLCASGARANDITRVIYSMATILDALDPVRNRASIAHPNENLLAEPEAMLIVNTTRTLMHYLNARLRSEQDTNNIIR